jgi:PrtD family type I secretion system ABC transporter
MLQVFERVMGSRNAATLMVLFSIAVFLIAVWTVLERIRARMLQQIGIGLDAKISEKVFSALNRQTDSLSAAARATVIQDLSTIRDFISGSLIVQIFDFVWVPLIVLVVALFHPILGLALLGLTIIVTLLALATQRFARDDVLRSTQAFVLANEFGRSVLRSAEAARVMGMMPVMVRRWRRHQEEALGWQQGAINRTGWLSGTLAWLRHMYMPLMLAVGAFLYLNEMVGAGVIFAASMVSIRAVTPVDAIANNWRAFWNVALASQRIEQMLREAAKTTRRVALPAPDGPLIVSRIVAKPRNRDAAILQDVSFSVEPARVVGVVGASGAGKSSLARVLCGAWSLQRGSITLDGHELSHWDQDQLGRYIGYVPQDVELFPGTVAENIARFDEAGDNVDADVVEAVSLANVQDIISRLPDGLNTKLGPDGHVLSSGQRQRIALARAVYRNPRLLILDEPNSNLDAVGEQLLAETLTTLRNRGAIIILVTHRMNMLTYCDDVLVMNAGTVHAFGSRDQIVSRLAGLQVQKSGPERAQLSGSADKTIAA